MGAIIKKQEDRELSYPDRWDPFRIMRNWMSWDPSAEVAPFREAPLDFVPSFEVKETEDSYLFKGDLPGIKEADLEISISGNRLSISGRREQEQRQEHDKFFMYERAYGSFYRAFTLPDSADTDHIHADLSDGVLTLGVPKKADVKPKRIKVKKAQKH